MKRGLKASIDDVFFLAEYNVCLLSYEIKKEKVKSLPINKIIGYFVDEDKKNKNIFGTCAAL